MSDESDPKIADMLAREVHRILPSLTFNDRAQYPISDALVHQKDSDYHSEIVQFPIVIITIYGTGNHAIVFKIRDAQGALYAMRIGAFSKREFSIHDLLMPYEMAPRIHYVGEIPNTTKKFTIMDKISGTLKNYLSEEYDAATLMKALSCLLDKKALLNMVHGDMHYNNIVILKDGSTLGFIDFDFSFVATPRVGQRISELVVLDFIPLCASVLSRGDKRATDLLYRILKYYKNIYQMQIHTSKIKTAKDGGNYYGRLASYVVDTKIYQSVIGKSIPESAIDFAPQEIKKEFPTFAIPKIIS